MDTSKRTKELLIFMSLPFRLSVTKLVSYDLSVYPFVGTLVETKIPTQYYNGYLFAARNQTRPHGINNTDNALYSVGKAQNKNNVL